MGFVKKAFKGVTKIVGGAFKAIGGLAVSTVNFAVDKIVAPVVSAVGDFMQTALDNPLKAIAQIAVFMNPQFAWALPLIEAADVAIAGGDFGDVLKAVAVSYAAQTVGSYVGKVASGVPTAIKYGTNIGSQQTAMLAAQEIAVRTAEGVAGQILGSAAAGATVAVITGQNPVQAFLTGGVGAAVPAVLGQVSGFSNLPPSAQKIIEGAVTAQLTGVRGDMAAAVIGGAIQATDLVTKTIEAFDPSTDENGNAIPPAQRKMNDVQRAIAADILMGSATAALSGGSVPAVVQSTFMKYGSKMLGDMVKSGAKDAIAAVKDKYFSAEQVADKADANVAKQEESARNYNRVVTELNGRMAEQERLKGEHTAAMDALKKAYPGADLDGLVKTYNAGFKLPAVGAALAATKAYNDYATKLNEDYTKTYKPQLDQYTTELTEIQEEFGNLQEVYSNAIKGVAEATDEAASQLKPIISESNKAFVTAMDPNFNAEEYKNLYGIDDGVDVYGFWLTKGQLEGHATNAQAAEAEFVAEKTRLLTELAAEKGISVSQISEKDASNFFSRIDSKYGQKLSDLKAASVADVARTNASTPPNYDALLTDSKAQGFAPNVDRGSYGAWNAPAGYTPPAGTKLATREEQVDNSAHMAYTADGKQVWLSLAEGIDKWDAAAGEYHTVLPTVIVTAPTFDELLKADPVSWLANVAELPESAKGGIDTFLYNFAKASMDLAKSSGNSAVVNAAGNALKAGGGVLEAFNGLVVLAGLNPKETSVGKFADKLVGLGKATTTEEYRAAIEDINKTIGDATGVLGTAKAIWGAFTEHPSEFLAEMVGVEAMQELVPLLVGGGAATVAKGAAAAAGMGAKLAAQIGTRVGLTAAATSDVAESVGGSAQAAFSEAYKTAQAKGMSEADATNYALNVGARNGVVSGLLTMASLGFGGGALEKAVFGKSGNGDLAGALDVLAKRVQEGATIATKEGGTELLEEGLSQAHLESELYKLDPTRDVSGNIASSAILGAIAGGGVAGGTYSAVNTGSFVANVLANANPTVAATVNNSTSATQAAQALNSLGINDAKLQANLLNTKYDADFTSVAEAQAALSNRPDFTPTDADIAALVGSTPNANLGAAADAYVDPRTVTAEEIKAAAAAEGYDISDEEAAALAGQKDEVAAIAAAREQFNPLSTTYAEAEKFLRDQGYDPTPEEVQQFVGSVAEEAQAAAVREYVDPKQVTFDEAKQYLVDVGYINPTDEEVRQFVGQVNQADQATKIAEYADPRVVSEQEVRDAYAALGLQKPAPEDVAKLVGQYAQSELTGKAELNLDSARYNSIIAQLDSLSAGANPETLAAIDKVKQDLNSQIAALGGDVTTKYDALAAEQAAQAAALGRPGAQPTQADLDAIITLLETQGAYDRNYDYNNDGKIDQTDQNALQQYVRQQEPGYVPGAEAPFTFAPAAGSKWAPTGVFDAVAQEAAKTRANQAQAALTTQRMGNLNTMMSMLSQAPDIGGQQVTVKAPDPAKIGYIYDWSSIFANPAQEKMFATPYAQGGAVRTDDDVDYVNDELLKMLRG